MPKRLALSAMRILVSCSQANPRVPDHWQGKSVRLLSLIVVKISGRHVNNRAAVSFSQTPKCFMTRSVSCPPALGSSRMRWQRHILCTTAKGTLCCPMSYCKSNVPWKGNRGTRYQLHRKPKQRKPSTLWDRCEGVKATVKLLFSLPLPSRSISDTGRTNFFGITANSYVGPFPVGQIALCHLSSCSV